MITTFSVLITAISLLFSFVLRSNSADGQKAGSLTEGYVTYGSQRFDNHSYVDVTTLAKEKTWVVCHSPLHTCCSSAQGPDRANWIDPNDQQLPFVTSKNNPVYQSRRPQAVELRCSSETDGGIGCSNRISGLYRCDVPVRGNDPGNEHRRVKKSSIFVGLYSSRSSKNGELSIEGPTLTSSGISSNEQQFVFTCISSGGPVSEVTWTGDSTILASLSFSSSLSSSSSSSSSSSVLLDQAKARYSHSLTLYELKSGLYTCTVRNGKPSSADGQLSVKDPAPPSIIGMTQRGSDTVCLEWEAPDEDKITGYIITHRRYGNTNSVSTTTGAAETDLCITELMPGATYLFSIRAVANTMQGEQSESREFTIDRVTMDRNNDASQSGWSLWWAWLVMFLVVLLIWQRCGLFRKIPRR